MLLSLPIDLGKLLIMGKPQGLSTELAAVPVMAGTPAVHPYVTARWECLLILVISTLTMPIKIFKKGLTIGTK